MRRATGSRANAEAAARASWPAVKRRAGAARRRDPFAGGRSTNALALGVLAGGARHGGAAGSGAGARGGAGASPERVVVGIDARDGRVAVQGWTRASARLDAVELARRFEDVGRGGDRAHGHRAGRHAGPGRTSRPPGELADGDLHPGDRFGGRGRPWTTCARSAALASTAAWRASSWDARSTRAPWSSAPPAGEALRAPEAHHPLPRRGPGPRGEGRAVRRPRGRRRPRRGGAALRRTGSGRDHVPGHHGQPRSSAASCWTWCRARRRRSSCRSPWAAACARSTTCATC